MCNPGASVASSYSLRRPERARLPKPPHRCQGNRQPLYAIDIRATMFAMVCECHRFPPCEVGTFSVLSLSAIRR
jgi:hypothetical protein